jgi:hypothetical protein
MALKIIGRAGLLKFIPSTEIGAEKPTTFFIRQETVETAMLRNRLFELDRSGKGIEFASNEKWINYFLARIIKIENIEKEGKIICLEDGTAIAEFLESPFDGAYKIGSELVNFLITDSKLSDNEIKN